MFNLNSKKLIISVFLILSVVFAGSAFAKDEVRFVSVSWTGVTVKTELGVKILESLGYEASNTMVSVPIAYKALDSNEADIFLGYWYPSMTTIAKEYFDKGTVDNFVENMPGAKYTLAAPSYVVDGGLKDFSDIAKYGDKLDWKIYGIEEGNDGNQIILDMIEDDKFGLGDFELVTSSEAGMLSQVQSYAKRDKWIVFLGWAPHQMNENIDMKYLTGSTSETFGANDGSATVYTNIRKGFDKEMPNVADFLKNFKFPIPMMNQIMATLHENPNMDPVDAGLDWVKDNPEIYKKWLDGIETTDGKPALKAFEKYLDTL
ncbi:MAG: ABC transporter substrate-binding protein [Thermodesulfobacteriota bacterium]